MQTQTQQPLFPLGQVVATPGALEALREAGIAPLTLLNCHIVGDGGDLDDMDRRANEYAILTGARVFSAYEITGATIWVITEGADDAGQRQATTLLLPQDY